MSIDCLIFHIKVFMMRIKLMLAALLFLRPSNICCSKENKDSNVETENLPHIDLSIGPDIKHDDKTCSEDCGEERGWRND